jgi:hypothetical protein
MAPYEDAILADNVFSLALAREVRRRRNLAMMNPWMMGMWLWWAMLISIWIAAYRTRPTI